MIVEWYNFVSNEKQVRTLFLTLRGTCLDCFEVQGIVLCHLRGAFTVSSMGGIPKLLLASAGQSQDRCKGE